MLRVAFENFILGLGGYLEATEITGDDSTLSLLKAKGQRFGRPLEGNAAFTRIQEVSGVPDIGAAFAAKQLQAAQLVALRHSKHAQALRDWFADGQPNDSAQDTLRRYVESIGKATWRRRWRTTRRSGRRQPVPTSVRLLGGAGGAPNDGGGSFAPHIVSLAVLAGACCVHPRRIRSRPRRSSSISVSIGWFIRVSCSLDGSRGEPVVRTSGRPPRGWSAGRCVVGGGCGGVGRSWTWGASAERLSRGGASEALVDLRKVQGRVSGSPARHRPQPGDGRATARILGRKPPVWRECP